MRVITIVICMVLVLFVTQSASAIVQDIETSVNITVRMVDATTRRVTVWLPPGSWPDEERYLPDFCSGTNESFKLNFRFPYEVEYNMSALQDDIGGNISAIFNITGEIRDMLNKSLGVCDKIKQANTELSMQLIDFNNKSEQVKILANVQDQYRSCEQSLNRQTDELNEAKKELDENEKNKIWIILVSAAAGAAILYFVFPELRYRKELPSGPADEQLRLR